MITMQIATVSFDRGDEAPDWTQTDIHRLQEVVMAVLRRHFGGYDRAAVAQAEYEQVQAAVAAADGATLFGATETMRAALAAHPKATEWAAFKLTAAEAIEPYCFSIRFTANN